MPTSCIVFISSEDLIVSALWLTGDLPPAFGQMHFQSEDAKEARPISSDLSPSTSKSTDAPFASVLLQHAREMLRGFGENY